MITLHGLMRLDDLLLWYTIGYPLKCKTDLTITLTGGRGMCRYRYSFIQDSI